MTLPEMESLLKSLLEDQLIATNEGTHGEPDSWRRYLRPDGSKYITGSGRPNDGIGYERTFSHEPSRVRLPRIERLQSEITAARLKVRQIAEDTKSRYRGNGVLGHPYGGPSYPLEEDLLRLSKIDPVAAERLRSELMEK